MDKVRQKIISAINKSLEDEGKPAGYLVGDYKEMYGVFVALFFRSKPNPDDTRDPNDIELAVEKEALNIIEKAGLACVGTPFLDSDNYCFLLAPPDFDMSYAKLGVAT